VNPSGLKVWLLALRPKTLTAAVVPVVVATGLVHGEGFSVVWWRSAFALLSAIFIQIGTNLFNDAIDFKKGADTHTRTGPRRVTQSGLLTEKQVMTGATCCFLIALLFGIPLVMVGGLPIVAIGVVSLALGYAYTGGPFPLAYLGLGDLFVVLFFGLIAVGGTYFLNTQLISPGALVAGLQVGCLATVLIAINNLRDAPQDRLVAKKTLAVRFGLRFSRVEIACLVGLPFVLQIYWVLHQRLWAGALPLLALPLAVSVLRGVFRHEPSPLFNRFLGLAAGLQLVFGFLLALGLWF
jgi:1,4-dihydroxy-2-naphthoate octaprenyltransferase